MRFFSVLICMLMTLGNAQAQIPLSIVEGAACAQNAAHIEALEQYNKDVFDEIGQLQAASDRKLNDKANDLLLHYERMTQYRRNLISEYELLCSRGTMPYSDFRKVCSPQSSGVSFEDTVFCAPLKNVGQ